MSNEERLRKLGLSNYEKRRLRGDLVAPCSFLSRENGEGGADLCSIITDDRIQGNGTKLHHRRFRLDIRKKLFTVRVVKNWNSLPRDVIDASSSSVFKRHLDDVL